jgi:hypothetical protein
MINEDSDTFQSDLYQFVEKFNEIFIDTSKETFRSKIFYKENTSKIFHKPPGFDSGVLHSLFSTLNS